MIKKIGLNILLAVFVLVSNAQNVLTIEDENISLAEFKSIFYKNNHDSEITKEYLNEYMTLFVNFKLKVKEAKELGLDTISSFVTELEGYRQQLAKPYLRNNEFDAAMLDEAYDRMKKDVNASHILVAVDENATDKDNEKAYKKALEIRKSIIAREVSFKEAAKNNSDDKSAVANGGNLGYFTVFMMVYNFETAAYETDINKISMPVRTKYGYHLIKVNDRRDALGQVKVAHIMFKTGQGADENKVNQAKDKINEVMQLLQDGEEFTDVAERFSEDRSTAVKGGALPVFGVGKMVPEFESVAFSLNSIGDISTPFKTEYGWHIITLLDKKPIPELIKIDSELKRKIERDSRGELAEKALYKKLRDTYKVINKPSVYSSFRKGAALKVSDGNFSLPKPKNGDVILFTINEESAISTNSFAEYLVLNQFVGSNIDIMYSDFVNEQLLVYEESQLEIKHPEYKALLKEYREGILLFDLTNTKVWRKAVEDTVGLQNFYNKNSSNYLWEKRIDATVYSCINLVVARRVKRYLYKKHRGNITDSEILTEINTDAPLNLQINTKKFIKGENEYVDAVKWEVGVASDIKTKDGSYIIVDVHEVLDSGEKELNDTRGKVISDYQNALEKEWLYSLRSKYTISIDTVILHSLIR
ncbi:peptidylprolyl isomerase [Flavobacteriales bacterium]|nr:peptidylprolyl isomerase [Flavobacteriales bacterium]